MQVQTNQKEIVLDHMVMNGSITSIEAFELYKITRISAVIHQLRHVDKIKIDMKREKQALATGKSKSFGVYTITH
jgi:hypothetical protein